LVHHSDRGVQYASEPYRQRLAAAGSVPSMSRKGNCYDNTVMESFWSNLKREQPIMKDSSLNKSAGLRYS
jgi:transposase InsO family protein